MILFPVTYYNPFDPNYLTLEPKLLNNNSPDVLPLNLKYIKYLEAPIKRPPSPRVKPAAHFARVVANILCDIPCTKPSTPLAVYADDVAKTLFENPLHKDLGFQTYVDKVYGDKYVKKDIFYRELPQLTTGVNNEKIPVENKKCWLPIYSKSYMDMLRDRDGNCCGNDEEGVKGLRGRKLGQRSWDKRSGREIDDGRGGRKQWSNDKSRNNWTVGKDGRFKNQQEKVSIDDNQYRRRSKGRKKTSRNRKSSSRRKTSSQQKNAGGWWTNSDEEWEYDEIGQRIGRKPGRYPQPGDSDYNSDEEWEHDITGKRLSRKHPIREGRRPIPGDPDYNSDEEWEHDENGKRLKRRNPLAGGQRPQPGDIDYDSDDEWEHDNLGVRIKKKSYRRSKKSKGSGSDEIWVHDKHKKRIVKKGLKDKNERKKFIPADRYRQQVDRVMQSHINNTNQYPGRKSKVDKDFDEMGDTIKRKRKSKGQQSLARLKNNWMSDMEPEDTSEGEFRDRRNSKSGDTLNAKPSVKPKKTITTTMSTVVMRPSTMLSIEKALRLKLNLPYGRIPADYKIQLALLRGGMSPDAVKKYLENYYKMNEHAGEDEFDESALREMLEQAKFAQETESCVAAAGDSVKKNKIGCAASLWGVLPMTDPELFRQAQTILCQSCHDNSHVQSNSVLLEDTTGALNDYAAIPSNVGKYKQIFRDEARASRLPRPSTAEVTGRLIERTGRVVQKLIELEKSEELQQMKKLKNALKSRSKKAIHGVNSKSNGKPDSKWAGTLQKIRKSNELTGELPSLGERRKTSTSQTLKMDDSDPLKLPSIYQDEQEEDVDKPVYQTTSNMSATLAKENARFSLPKKSISLGSVPKHSHHSSTRLSKLIKEGLLPELHSVQSPGGGQHTQVIDEVVDVNMINPSWELASTLFKTPLKAPAIPLPENLVLHIEKKFPSLKWPRGTPIALRYYPSGQPFCVVFQNGSGRVHYPHGGIAVAISAPTPTYSYSRVLVIRDPFDQFYFFDKAILADLNCNGNGTVFDENGSLKLQYNVQGGYRQESEEKMSQRWQWNRGGHRIIIKLNRYMALRIMDLNKIYLVFYGNKRGFRINLGAGRKVNLMSLACDNIKRIFRNPTRPISNCGRFDYVSGRFSTPVVGYFGNERNQYENDERCSATANGYSDEYSDECQCKYNFSQCNTNGQGDNCKMSKSCI